jgi:predicted enzyme related to lactoylglutathione lyase
VSDPVQHFEVYGDDPENLGACYRDVFGWQVDKVPGMDYWMLITGPSNKDGQPTKPGMINGGLMKRPMPDARMWMNYVTVPSLESAMTKIEAAGGKIYRRRTAVPKMGYFAVVADPEGNPFGIWQSDDTAA